MVRSFLVGRTLGTLNGTIAGTVIGVGAYLLVGGTIDALLWGEFVGICSAAFAGALSAAAWYLYKPVPGLLAGVFGGLVGFIFVWLNIPQLPYVSATGSIVGFDVLLVKYLVVLVLIPMLPTWK